MPLLPQSFYARDALDVARDLLGMLLRRDAVVLRITEVEAYRWPADTANHCFKGRTPRNGPMWGPPGRAYVYLCYGMHHMLNIVTNPQGEGAAVLIRSCEPVEGIGVILKRRNTDRAAAHKPALLTGPGRVAQALGLDLTFNNHALYKGGGLQVCAGIPPIHVLAGPRVGIDYAAPEDICAPWRLADGDSQWVSTRRTLKLMKPIKAAL